MKHSVIGLSVGALAGIGALELEQRHLPLLVLVLVLAVGALTGALVAWRVAPPGAALRGAALTGALVDGLFLVGALAGGATSTHLRLAVALVSLVLYMGVTFAVAGIVSAWTGYHSGHAKKGRTPARPTAESLPTMA